MVKGAARSGASTSASSGPTQSQQLPTMQASPYEDLLFARF
jgi:hypothetical protein